MLHFSPFRNCAETPGGTWTGAKTKKKKDKDLEKNVPSPEKEGIFKAFTSFPETAGQHLMGPPTKHTGPSVTTATSHSPPSQPSEQQSREKRPREVLTKITRKNSFGEDS